jgi:hypothetical protein
MRWFLLIARGLAAMSLSSCVGTTAAIPDQQQKSLQALQLFNPDASPRFSVDLACSEKYGSCATPENIFSNWARSNNISLHVIASGDAVLVTGRSGSGSQGAFRYRITIQLEPVVMPSFDESGGVHGNMSSGYMPPKVGYTATLRVFEAASAKMLLEVHAHDQRIADDKTDASAYFRLEMEALINALGPAHPVR